MEWTLLALASVFFASIFVISASEQVSKETKQETATFAGGCFWCLQNLFDGMEGIVETTVGYTGGNTPNPTYEQVCAGDTGHAEAIRIAYDPEAISYQELLDVFWHNIDPTALNRQFCDTGTQYRTAIYTHSAAQKQLAEASKESLQKSGKFDIIHTEIAKAGPFYPAEAYHQAYYKKNPFRYNAYCYFCGREQRLHELWGKTSTQTE